MLRSLSSAFGIAVLVCSALTIGLAAQDTQVKDAAASGGRLTLRNGDYLSGTFTASDNESTVAWLSPSFLDPLEFSTDTVQLIEFGAKPMPKNQPSENQDPIRRLSPAAGIIELIRSIPRPSKPAETIRPEGARLALHGNAVLYGRIVEWGDDTITIESARHDRTVLHRSWIRELEGLNEQSTLLFDGGGQLNSWKSIGEEPRSLDEWSQDGNELITSTKGANLYYEASEGGPWSLELTLHGGSKVPEFQIALGAGASLQDLMKAYCVDNWGNQLVAYREGDGEIQLQQLSGLELKANQPLTLLIYFDPAKQELTVYSQGVRLGQLVVPGKVEAAQKGLLIRNRGKELRVLAARLRRWNGEISDLTPSTSEDRVFGIGGKRWVGRIESVDIPNNKLVLRTESETQELNWSEMDRIQLATPDSAIPQPDESGPKSVLVHYSDGESLQGKYAGASAEGLLVQIPQSPSPLLCRVQQMRRVQFGTTDPAATAALDKTDDATALVEGYNHRLHGRVVNAKSASQLAWLPYGGLKPSRFASTTGTKVTFEPAGYSLDEGSSDCILSLTTGESFPCQLESLTAESVQFRLPGGHSTAIASDRLKALRFQPKDSWIYEGLRADDRWLALSKEGVKWRDETLTFYRPNLLARELPITSRMSIEFDLKFHSEAGLNAIVGLGADVAENGLRRPQDFSANEETLRNAAKERPDYVAEVLITRNRRSLSARGLSRAAGVMGLMFQGNPFPQQEQLTALPLSEAATAHIEVQIDPQQREYVVRGNGQVLHRWRDTTPLVGNFFYLGVTTEADSVIHGATTSDNPIASIHNLRIRRWAGEMAQDDRERFLTRRVGANPKAITHVLRAVNGDNLRGRLLGISKESVEFQSRLDTLSIPRSKVAEIIRVARNEESPAPPTNSAPSAESTSTEVPATTSPSGEDRGDGRIVLRSGESIVLRGLQATDTVLTGTSLVGPLSLHWPEISEIHFGSLDVPSPPYTDWVQRDPPPLPEMPASAGEQPPSPLLDKPAPDFELELLDGQKASLAGLRGKIVILDFWATWCGPCLNSLPILMEIEKENKEDITLIAVNQQEDPEELRAFLATQLWDLTVGLDRDGQLGQVYGASAIPLTVVLDREGVVRHVHVGSTPDLKQDLMKTIDRLRASSPPASR